MAARINATSGPRGEGPDGTMTLVSFTVGSITALTAQVECVKVIGNASVVTGTLQNPPPDLPPSFDGMGFYIEDRSALGLHDLVGVFFLPTVEFPPAHACMEFTFESGPSLSVELKFGNFIVRDS